MKAESVGFYFKKSVVVREMQQSRRFLGQPKELTGTSDKKSLKSMGLKKSVDV